MCVRKALVYRQKAGGWAVGFIEEHSPTAMTVGSGSQLTETWGSSRDQLPPAPYDDTPRD
jgi:hypothetical protein